MMEQERLLGRDAPRAVPGVVPEQRGPGGLPEQATVAYAGVPYRSEPPQGGGGPVPGARLRVDARRNLESVLRAAREVFGEFGYGAPMEEVARRAGVGVGTVYRRFPSKEVLVQRIAAEEVAWLTSQARESLYGGGGAWESLAGYLARAVSTGAGRLLPPEAFRYADELGRVPEQRSGDPVGAGGLPGGRFEPSGAGPFGSGSYGSGSYDAGPQGAGPQGAVAQQGGAEPPAADADPRLLLQLLAALVARAGAAGELRPGVTVADVVLVLTASVPVHATRAVAGEPVHASAVVPAGGSPTSGRPTDGQASEGPADRLLQILLDGLRAR
ncbi:TetR/AcrR family transcriptional regulator [Streptomyces sp. CB01881]|uniref:TetR/AcrR family transcriptional regulator n=1 Tax=Streptomyces sp. CB01881 TaxID=2078691 RepID=UPI000CDBB51D|nr:TetR/AcrR family transcriptional regulator [Streptomyces sp. CB01881]AUY50347.1 TetR family transcriptional regulator [Streptomyces sp. CB01881]TYC73734.1 TetR/AcrR family transcriptional regulator [Streptomyces sp. CB01881]